MQAEQPWDKVRTLCAILLNPPVRPTNSTITYRNLTTATSLIGCELLRLVNLLDVPSKDQIELGMTLVPAGDVVRSRKLLLEAMSDADEVLFAWGSSRIIGPAKATLQEQAAWCQRQAAAVGFRSAWMVAGVPRHPSRWRQYVGPEKQRVQGDSFEERLAKVLIAQPFSPAGQGMPGRPQAAVATK